MLTILGISLLSIQINTPSVNAMNPYLDEYAEDYYYTPVFQVHAPSDGSAEGETSWGWTVSISVDGIVGGSTSFSETIASETEDGECKATWRKCKWRWELWKDYGDPEWEEEYCFITTYEIYVSKPIHGDSKTHCDDDTGLTTFTYNNIESIGLESRYLENDGEHDHDAPGTWTLTKSAAHNVWFEQNIPLTEWVLGTKELGGVISLKNTYGQTVTYDYIWNAYTHYRWDYIGGDRCVLAFHDMDA